MDFGSEYILLEDEEEEVYEEDINVAQATSQASSVAKGNVESYFDDYSGFECEIMDFDEDEDEQQTQVQAPVKERKVNTNTVKVDFKKLEEKPDVMVEMSKHAVCVDCDAVYSHLAKTDADKKVWVCNFCNKENDIKTELPDLSDKNDIMYVEDTSRLPELKPSESSKLKIIFLIDTSSSMCQTKAMDVTRASQTMKDIIKKDSEKQQLQLLAMLPPNDMIGQPPSLTQTNTEVSRLQAIKASVIDVIKKLRSEQPDIQVGLITFHENVNVYGDGRSEVTIVQEDQLSKMEDLQTIGQKYSELCPLRESADNLIQKIEYLEENGRTALGPALVIAQSMANYVKGSKIILCTDGIANIGLGRLEETTEKQIDKFYNEVIAKSKSSGVPITVICVDNAGLNTRLGQVPTESGGSLEKVQATEVEAKILEELKRATVAVNAYIKFVVHKNLYVNNTKSPESKCSQYFNQIGNLQLDKQMAFSFAFKPQEQPPVQPQDPEKSEMKPDDDLLPFQVQVKYFNLSVPSVQVVRVWTAERKMTDSRAKAEETMNSKTVVDTFLQQSSQKLLELMHAKKGVIYQANEYSTEAHRYSETMRGLDQVTLSKLRSFKELMINIVINEHITEDHIPELNKFKDARAGQVQG